MPCTSGYNLRPRRGAKVESQPTNEKRTQQGEPVRARGSREHQYSPYIEEQAKSEAEEVNNSTARKRKAERTADDPNLSRF
ncbi:hypothetical protein TNCV_2949641 [Trichonephila clavipes]|nr:hypothetical protein TNCV_2949641 [Trichonephila clavipes]